MLERALSADVPVSTVSVRWPMTAGTELRAFRTNRWMFKMSELWRRIVTTCDDIIDISVLHKPVN